MQIYFYEDRFEKAECRDGNERFVGGVQVPPDAWRLVQHMDLNWDDLPEETSEYDLIPGNIVGVHLHEIGPQPLPYVVAEIDEDPDKEKYERIVILENTACEDIENIVVSCGMRGTRADYKHDETSRYVAGDGITLAFVPDLLLADVLGADELRSHITSVII